MTAVQKARQIGFNASLAQRGVMLLLPGTEATFNTLLERITPDAGEFSMSDETRAAAKIHILRDAEGINRVSVGSVFTDTSGANAHRVTRIEDHPANIAVVFYCETSPAE